jgi:Arc/MetJ-type ribon-helix-helix transcriptional regulator
MASDYNERVTLRLTIDSMKELDELTKEYGFKNRSETMRALILGQISPSRASIDFIPNDILDFASHEVRDGYFPTVGEAVRYYMRVGYEYRRREIEKEKGEKKDDYRQSTIDDFLQE